METTIAPTVYKLNILRVDNRITVILNGVQLFDKIVHDDPSNPNIPPIDLTNRMNPHPSENELRIVVVNEPLPPQLPVPPNRNPWHVKYSVTKNGAPMIEVDKGDENPATGVRYDQTHKIVKEPALTEVDYPPEEIGKK